jgi:excisionase family DNA binding protein
MRVRRSLTQDGALPLLLTYGQAARELTVGVTTVTSLVRDGRIRAVRLGPQTVRIPRAELEQLISRTLSGDGVETLP